MQREGIYKSAFFSIQKPATAMRIYLLDRGGPKDSENTLNSFLTKPDEDGFWQIGADMWATQHIASEILITRDPNTDSFWILFALVIDSEWRRLMSMSSSENTWLSSRLVSQSHQCVYSIF